MSPERGRPRELLFAGSCVLVGRSTSASFERRVKPVFEPLVEAREQVAVPIERDADRRVAEPFLNLLRMGSLRYEQRGTRVTEINMTARYPELRGLSAYVKTDAVVDGEIVCFDPDGRPDFAALWGRSRGSTVPPVCFMAFDVLQLGDKLLIDKPYRGRRRILEDLELAGPHRCTSPSHVGEGAALFAATKQMGLEGVVAKRLDSRYRPGLRSRSWIKTKHFQTRTLALLGWLPPREWRGDRGCVTLGLETRDGIALAGVVESGYSRELVDQLPEMTRDQLRALEGAGRLWDGHVPATAQIKYLEWVPGMGLRHATVVRARSVASPDGLGAATSPG